MKNANLSNSRTNFFDFFASIRNSKKEKELMRQEDEKISELVWNACQEIKVVIRDQAFSTVVSKNLKGQYLDVRIDGNMDALVMTNTSYVNPVYKEDESGNFIYLPLENPSQTVKLTTASQIDGDAEFKRKFCLRLRKALVDCELIVGNGFYMLKDTTALLAVVDLFHMEDPTSGFYTDLP